MATEVARKIYDVYRNLTAATTVVGVLQIAYSAVSTAIQAVQTSAAKKQQENLQRREATRNGFVRRYYQAGAFSQVLSSKRAPSPEALDLTRNLKKPQKHLDQYDREYVFHVSRVGRSQTLWPTWTTRPYDAPGGSPDVWEGGFTFAEQMLGGYRDGKFKTTPRAIGAIPARYADKYWGNAPGGGNIEAKQDIGWRLDWGPLDASVFVAGYAPPPNYEYLFSWGTYPYVSWTTLFGLDAERRYDECADLLGLAAAIHGITPIHARIRWAEVEVCYRHFLSMTQWRSWPAIPDGQVDTGLYVRKGLPYSPAAGWPVVIGPYQVPWEVVRDIELLFRQWFALRTAILFQFTRASDSFKAAAALSLDPALVTLAKGGAPPEWRGFDEADPLGDSWQPGVVTPRPNYAPLPGLKSRPTRSRSGGAGLAAAAAGLVVLGGVAAVAASQSKRRTR